MKNLLFITCFFFAVMSARSQDISKEFPEVRKIRITNTLARKRTDVFVFIPAEKLSERGPVNSSAFVVLDNGREIASQYNASELDAKGIALVLDELGPKEVRELQVRFNKQGASPRTYRKRTQAELSHKTGGKFENRVYIGGEFKNVDFMKVPPEHKDHSWFIRYEGPGWESDKVGYRFYLDQRNANDVFGKATHDMILQNVGLDGFESYHHLLPWGMDVMKAGKSLGMASIGSLVNGNVIRVEKTDSVDSRITQNGVVYSSILTNYYGWMIGEKKYTLQSQLSISGGSRLTRTVLNFDTDPDNVTTGLVKDKSGVLLKSKGDKNHWGYLATYGKQSLNTDNLGVAIFFDPATETELTEDSLNHLVKLKSQKGTLVYYFLACWEKEPDGIKDQPAFERYINEVAQELASPVKTEVLK